MRCRDQLEGLAVKGGQGPSGNPTRSALDGGSLRPGLTSGGEQSLSSPLDKRRRRSSSFSSGVEASGSARTRHAERSAARQLDLIPVEEVQEDLELPCPTPVVLVPVKQDELPHGWRARSLSPDAPDRIVKRCGRRKCPSCGPHWARYAKASMLSRLKISNADGRVLFVTVTAPGEADGLDSPEAIAMWNAGASKRRNHLIELIRQAFPADRKEIQFFRVGELQERGAIHYHLAMRGLRWLPKDVLQRLAVQAGFGYVVDVRPLRNVGGGVTYFAKYLLKDADKWPTGRRVWSCSAQWRVTWSPRSPFSGKFPARLLSTGEEFLSVSPWRYDRRESVTERRRLREGMVAFQHR